MIHVNKCIYLSLISWFVQLSLYHERVLSLTETNKKHTYLNQNMHLFEKKFFYFSKYFYLCFKKMKTSTGSYQISAI